MHTKSVQRHIEFAGTPGVGKSTLVGEFLDYLNGDGERFYSLPEAERLANLRSIGIPKPVTIQDIVPRWVLDTVIGAFPSVSKQTVARYQLFFCTYPELGRIIPTAIERKLTNTEDRQTYFQWFFQLISAFQAANQWFNETESLVIDEGFVNRTITLFCGRDDIKNEWNKKITEYLSQAPHPDILIIPEAPIEICERRIRTGDRSFPYKVDGSDKEQVRRFLTEREDCISIVQQYFESTPTTVITIDNSGKISRTKSLLQSEFSSIR